ncbi:U6 small ribonucleoprotein F [Myxozyma melibiosi]|uniref:U6 small ribonucleoprotein F n=1 Tax=Myxozyma melibiosi TaxID=54550 RepID=A0ABR1F5A7_9ASCO
MSSAVSPAGTPTPEAPSNNPSAFLSQIIGAKVSVKLNSGVEYKGDLQCVDGYMNIVLEQSEEYVDGELKHEYGDVFIRGNNVLYIGTI